MPQSQGQVGGMFRIRPLRFLLSMIGEWQYRAPAGQWCGRPAFRQFFVRQGLNDKDVLADLILHNGINGFKLAYEYERGRLSNFKQGAPWDAQRVGGHFHREYRDYATAAIGIYAAAAGIPRPVILEIENAYASQNSEFDKSEKFDWLYQYLPEKNVRNTEIGNRLYESGQLKSGNKD